jgi:dTDP-4-dehydrorhamnose 3,5-epimerase
MRVSSLSGVKSLVGLNPVIEDNRGSFTEIYPIKSDPNMFPHGIHQVSQSRSSHCVFRGFHFQVGMDKAIRVVAGGVDLVLVDIRRNSPTFGDHSTEVLSAVNGDVIYVPSGIAIGFEVITLGATVQYFHSTRFDPLLAFTIAWDDPTIGLKWDNIPIMSDKDAHEGMSLQDWVHTFESTLPAMQLTDRPLMK